MSLRRQSMNSKIDARKRGESVVWKQRCASNAATPQTSFHSLGTEKVLFPTWLNNPRGLFIESCQSIDFPSVGEALN